MSHKITWTVRQIPREVITAAKKASKNDRKTLGQWLSHVILEAARVTLTRKTEIAKPEDVSDTLQRLLERQERAERILDRLQKPWYTKLLGK